MKRIRESWEKGIRKGSNLASNFIKTMMKETYCIDFELDNRKFMKFDNSYWDNFVKTEKTFLNEVIEMVENGE